MMRWCLALGLLALVVPHAPACPLPSNFEWGRTFRQETKATGARVIVCGTIANPRLVGEGGLTDFFIETSLRDDPVMKGKTSLVVNRYLPIEKKNAPPRYVLFCEIEKGKVDPYRGFVVRRAASVEYVKKAIAFDGNDPVKHLCFYFEHLDDPDPAVSEDAFQEFAQADDFAIGAVGRRLGADKIRKRLEDPKTPKSHIGVYAKLIAAAGTAKDAASLFDILENDPDETHPESAAILVAYVMLAPKAGWSHTMSMLGGRGADFHRRYAALRAVRVLHDSRTGVVSNRQILSAYRLLLTQEDMADLAIEDLRRWKLWELTHTILGLADTNAHDVPTVRRSMLRYALQCEGNAAKAYVDARRKSDPEAVKDAQELLDEAAADARRRSGSPNK